MKKVGRYEIIGRLGQGGMGTVYKARTPITGRVVALKLLKPRDEIFVDLVGEEGLKEMFLEEARIMGTISHEHVAKILDCDEHQGMPFIVLEYFAHILGAIIGEEYDVEKRSRIMSSQKTFDYTSQMLLGLERLHFAGIVHRDMKPFNLMVTDDDRVKIIDFGLSKVRGEETMSIPGMQVGSPHYTAPEQIKNAKQADGRADLFSVGVMTYRMLTGVLPRWEYDRLVVPSAVSDAVHPGWDEFVETSLQRDVTLRYQSAARMQLALLDTFSRVDKDVCEEHETVSRVMSGPVAGSLRTEPVRIMYKEIREALKLDELMRPKAVQPNAFRLEEGLLAYHFESGLYWQRRGAGFPLSWEQAKAYIEKLNQEKWQGRNDWRLPTTEELCTILEPVQRQCMRSRESMFFPRVHWLWSCDSCTKKQAWMADVAENFIERLAKDGTASVCAVSCQKVE